MQRKPITAATIATVLVLALAACSSAAPTAWPGTATTVTGVRPVRPVRPGLDIDPRSFVDQYEETQYDSAGSSAATAGRAAGPEVASDVATPGGQLPSEPTVPGIDDGNTFEPTEPSGFVRTADDPQSTFGLDVDTGSYRIGRTFLAAGQLPPADSVRTEEWVNAFEYDYAPPQPANPVDLPPPGLPQDDSETPADERPAPTAEPGQGEPGGAANAASADGADGDVAIHVDGAPAPFDPARELLRLGLQTRSVSDADRPDANLTFVVDVSSSMDSGNRLGLVKASLALLVINLRDTDTLSIVTYSDDASVLLAPTRVRDAKRILAAIDELAPSNSTNMEAGLRKGYEQARSSFRPEAINTVILASDGVANVGDTGRGSLSDLIRHEGLDGLRLVTVGFGMGNYNDTLMEALADRGDGFYSYVDTYEEAERLFTKELTSTLTLTARDAKVQVTFDPDVVQSYRLLGYENRDVADGDFTNDAVDAGELGAGHAVTALYELELRDPRPDASQELGSVALRYRSMTTGDTTTLNGAISADRFATSFAQAPPNLRLAATVAELAELIGHRNRSANAPTLQQIADLASTLEAPADPSTGRATVKDLALVIDEARSAGA